MEGQDIISMLFGALPPEVARIIGNVLAVAITLRTVLLVLEKSCSELAIRFSADAFGVWCGRVADFCRKVDGVIETIFAVKAVLLRREGANIIVRGVRRKP